MTDRDQEESVETKTMVKPTVGGARVESGWSFGGTQELTDRGGTKGVINQPETEASPGAAID